ncbi:MAG TPA: PIN domain-containing protein [Solirubrobacteraceae bacterium]|nr:PIN domain-containing protein [Solirubrobacteraceae bacterium]
MSVLLLDASVILAAFDTDDEQHEPALALLSDPEVSIATLDLARYEVANVAVRAWGERVRIAAMFEAIDRISADGGVTPSTNTLLTRAAEIADEHEISVYDAAYVAAANQAGGTLVSCDIRDLVGKGLADSPAGMLEQEPAAPAEEGAESTDAQ